MSDHELGLCKQIDTLKSQLSLKETEVTVLQEQNTSKEGTIKELQVSVEQSKEIYRRGYSSTDIDDYLDKITSLTAQLCEVEERERACRVKNAELEQQVGVYSEMKKLTKRLFLEKSNLQVQVQALTSKLEEEKSRCSSTSNQACLTPLQENVDARLLSIEAHKVPELQEQVKRLKKELEDVRGYEQMTKTLEDQMIAKITEMSKKDEEIHQLKMGAQELQEQNTALISRIEDAPPRVTSDPSLAMQSEAYQILLQDSTAKDELIHRLQSFKSENESLRLELEVKAQELNSKSVEAEEKLTAKDGEIQRLSNQLVHKDRLNRHLRERVTALTVPLPAHARMRESEHQIQESESGQGSLEKELELANAQIAKMTNDIVGLVEHSKKQSKAILQLKTQLEEFSSEHVQECSKLKAELRQVSTEKAELQDKLIEIRHLVTDSSFKHEGVQSSSNIHDSPIDGHTVVTATKTGENTPSKLSMLGSNMEQWLSLLKRIESEVESAKKELDVEKSEKEKLNSSILDHQERIHQAEMKLSCEHKKIISLTAERKDLQHKISEKEAVVMDLKQQHHQETVQHQIKVQNLKRDLESVNSVVSERNSLKERHEEMCRKYSQECVLKNNVRESEKGTGKFNPGVQVRASVYIC